jgi:hypothetical protein
VSSNTFVKRNGDINGGVYRFTNTAAEYVEMTNGRILIQGNQYPYSPANQVICRRVILTNGNTNDFTIGTDGHYNMLIDEYGDWFTTNTLDGTTQGH